MKKLIALALVMIAVVSLVGCGGKNGATGTYKIVSFMGMEIEQANSLYNLGGGEGNIEDLFVLQLQSGGKATFTSNGQKAEGTYSIDGKSISLTVEGETLTGTIEDGKITLSIEGIELVFEKK